MTLKKIKHSLLLAAVTAVAFSCSGGASSAPTPKVSSLAAPADVKATTAPLKILVSWTAVAGATGYKLYHKTAPGVGTGDSNVTVSGDTAYSHEGLTDGQAYYYRVASIGADGESSLSTEVSATVTNAVNSGCAPVHTGALWTKSYCDPVGSIFIGKDSIGDDGVAFGDRPLNKGRIQFTISGTDPNYSDIEVYFLWFRANGGAEANWHLINYNGDTVRLISQRFDGACPGNNVAGYGGACEDTDYDFDLTFNSSKSYAFDCHWDYEGSQNIECEIHNADGNFRTRAVPMHGAYNSLDDLWVGNFNIFGKDSLQATVTNYRFSVLSDKRH